MEGYDGYGQMSYDFGDVSFGLRAAGDKASIERIGINYASNQCSELLDAEVDGIHFYTLNRSKATLEIYHNLGFNNYFDLERLRSLNNLYR